MKKTIYECKDCASNCECITDKVPTVCIKGIFKVNWQPVADPAPKSLSEMMMHNFPDWVKVENWVVNRNRSGANLSTPGRIRRVDSEGYFEVKWRELVTSETVDTVEPAYIRPWTFEEAPYQVKTKDDVLTLYFTISDTWEYKASKRIPGAYSLEEVTKLIQADGSPCGVAEVDK